VVGSTSRARPLYGLVLGAGVWSMSYVMLPLAKIYRPIWDYDIGSLWRELSVHLAYGIGVGAVFRAVQPPVAAAPGGVASGTTSHGPGREATPAAIC
jgi:uncharacterized membrane protein YagU involved in acid resistance